MKPLKQKRIIGRRGNPGTPEEILEAARTILDLSPGDSPRNIHDKLKKVYPEGHRLYQSIPTERTIRSHMPKLRPPAPEPSDDPWSLGESRKRRISPEADRDLLKLWRFCVIVGRTFTIREAIWASRLRAMGVPFEQLLYKAYLYARKERFSKTENTRDLDAQMAFLDGFSGYLYTAAIDSGIIEHPTMMAANISVLKQGTRNGLGTVITDDEGKGTGLLTLFLDVTNPGRSVERKLLFNSANEGHLQFKHDEHLSEEADMVYALRLRGLAREREWTNLDYEKREKVAKYLHKSIASDEGSWPAYQSLPFREHCLRKQSLSDILNRVNSGAKD